MSSSDGVSRPKHKHKQTIAEHFVVVGFDAQFNFDVLEQALSDHALKSTPPSSSGVGSVLEAHNTSLDLAAVKWDACVLDCYPLHAHAALPDGIEYFCFPEGLQWSTVPYQPTFHSFIHTSEDGSRMIGSVLAFSEELRNQQQEMLIQKVIRDSSSNPSVEDEVLCQMADGHKVKYFVRKGICILSCFRFMTSFKVFLKKLYQLTRSSSEKEYIPTHIPIERYICNFIDDVPSPPAGKVDITYFLCDEPISFNCPPLNEPNAWSGFPLFPIFECLSPINICHLLAVILVERQMLFVSSQYCLLTLCAEGITSLIYPFRWIHAYIPILPTALLGALGAPFPFIFGIHSNTFKENVNMVSSDTVRIFLDEDKIDFGCLGPPPSLPDRRYQKLLQHINAVVSRNTPGLVSKQNITPESYSTVVTSSLFERSQGNQERDIWKQQRLVHFDNAMESVVDSPVTVAAGNQDAVIREGFLKFFVAILKDYKKFLVYRTADEKTPQSNFKSVEFVSSLPGEWQPFMKEIVDTQLFSQFVEERVVMNKLDLDVIFFDESIDAKYNRYTFRFHNIDTPFLQHTNGKHFKTYVPPSPHTSDLEKDKTYEYSGFPKLNVDLFITPRNLTAKLSHSHDRLLGVLSKVRLKRKILGSHSSYSLSAAGCIFSTFIVAVSQFASSAVDELTIVRTKIPSLSTSKLINEYSTEGRGRSASVARMENIVTESIPSSPVKCVADSPIIYHDTIASAKLALKVSFEALNCLSRLDYSPDEIIYRCLAETCADLKDHESLIDLIIFMDEEGLIPDHQIRHSLIRALTPDASLSNIGIVPGDLTTCSIRPTEVWSFQQWRSLKREKCSLIMRSSFPQQSGGSIRGGETESAFAKFLFGSTSLSSSLPSPPLSMWPPHDDKVAFENRKSVRDRWSFNEAEGYVPSLKWNFNESGNSESDKSKSHMVFSASKKLNRQINLGEAAMAKTLRNFTLKLDHEFGTKCPNGSCSLQRPLTIGEIHQGWSGDGLVGDYNKYTTMCFACKTEFIPRFSVTNGNSTQWLEFLSPWTLHKEVLTLIFDNGISSLISSDLRTEESRSIIFWNLLIALRLRGLPSTLLFTNGLIHAAFPPPPNLPTKKRCSSSES